MDRTLASEMNMFKKIWDGDLFDRRSEALMLQGYLESLTNGNHGQHVQRAFTIAVDAGYGEGKSFLLKRFAEQVSINHPVAFVDAWADDLADQPMVALAATLKKALKPYLNEPEVKQTFDKFVGKAGRVAKCAGLGLIKRAAGMVITAPVVDELEGIVKDTGHSLTEGMKKSIEDGGKDLANGLIEDVSRASFTLMDGRINAFEEGQSAIDEMKKSLAAIVEKINKDGHSAPIIMVIDELDRCRPTYAIKLLEEIKHLFDVRGLIFILGVHLEQLSCSVSGAYGSKFDGGKYLSRFIDRRYKLRKPDAFHFVSQLCAQYGILEEKIEFFLMRQRNPRKSLNFFEKICAYFDVYSVSARDRIKLIHQIQTCISLSGSNRLQGDYLISLLIKNFYGLDYVNNINRNDLFKFYVPESFNKSTHEFNLQDLSIEIERALAMSEEAIDEAMSKDNQSEIIKLMYYHRDNGQDGNIHHITRYNDLISTVGRFSDPMLDASVPVIA